jgi:hypothetical protein
MKRILLLLTLGAALACPSFVKAQDSTNTPPSGPPPGAPHRLAFLTDAERQELKTAHDAAIAADPSLQTDEEALKASHQAGTPPTDADKAKWQAFHDKMDAAMIAADPNVAPILAKIKAHHRGGPDGGTRPTPPASS